MALVLLNPGANGGRARRLEPGLRSALQARHPGAVLAVPASVAASRALIEQSGAGARVVVVGGDGTLHALLPALLARRCELGLVPAGSGDDSARAFGLRGWPWPRALAHALDAPATAVDLGEVGTEHETRPFVSSLNAGFDAAVALRALHGPAWIGGLPRYLLATLQEIAALRLAVLRVAVDGRAVHDGPALFASTLNTPTYGGGMPAVPSALIDDGRLDLLLARRFGRAAALAMLPRLLVGRHLGHAEVQTHRFERLSIEAEAPLPLAADGEALTAARRVAVRVLAGALAVVTAR
jgi:diacylglycerol kinase (ATP)